MAMHKGGAQRKGQQENESDGGEPAVGDQLALTISGSGLGTMATGMQEAVFEGPGRCEIIPAVILQDPPIMT